MVKYPSISMKATGERITALRQKKSLSVREVSSFMGFENPQAVYRWQEGKTLPSVDNLLALSVLLGVSINEMLVTTEEADEASFHFKLRVQ